MRVTELHSDHLKRQRVAENVTAKIVATQLEDERQERRALRRKQADSRRNDLAEMERQSIRDAVVTQNPRLRLTEFPGILHRLCLDELCKRQSLIITNDR